MKKLGMWAAVRAIPPVMGQAFARAHGERSKDMPPLRMIQDSGIKDIKSTLTMVGGKVAYEATAGARGTR